MSHGDSYESIQAPQLMKSPPGQKFFHEIKGNSHLDAQYGQITLTKSDIIPELRFLLSELVKKCECDFVLMYGGLIGWHFNGNLLPWDDDIDLIVLEHDINRFVKYDGMETSRWVLKINPNYKNKSKDDVHNKIDARMISKQIGVFIDITFFWNAGESFRAKDGNVFQRKHMLPLQRSTFEGQPIWVPNQVDKVLIKRYGNNVTHPKYKDWSFVNDQWIQRQ
jgi:hypothetical protein